MKIYVNIFKATFRNAPPSKECDAFRNNLCIININIV